MENENTTSTPAVIVKFAGDFGIPYDESAGEHLITQGYEPWTRLMNDFPGVEIKPLFTPSEQECMASLVRSSRKKNTRKRGKGFFEYFRIKVPGGCKSLSVLDSIRKGWNEVADSYLELTPVCANPLSSYNTNPRAGNQTYLNAAPGGIGIKSLWSSPTVAGSDGSGISFIDVETGWNLNHEDLTGYSTALIGTNSSPSGIPHGTSVLGIVCANDNGKGCIGIAPNPLSVKVVSSVDSSIAGAIATAAASLNYGDVMLIEMQFQQTISTKLFYLPVEVSSAELAAIQAATDKGIIVIEAGGDGDLAISAVNFDTYQTATLDMVLNPSDPAFTDSGAIIVSASKSAESALVPGTHEKAAWAPFGTRVDCYAWGENIDTIDTNAAGTDNTAYTTSFGMSSGAAAIIAGAVMSIQGMVKASTNQRLSPLQMRDLLRNSAYGTNLHATGLATLMNVFMPDLSLINSVYIPTLPVFSATTSGTDATTPGGTDGTASASPVNGTAPYTYSWSNGATTKDITGLAAGTYTVTITDKNGCTTTGTVTIGEPGAITAHVDSTDISCNGAHDGTITISSVTGGTPPYQYSIDNGASWSSSPAFTDIGPGTCNVKIKDSTGFVKSLGAVTFTDPAALNAVVNSVNVSVAGAHDGSITISSATGGSGTYQYSIDGGITWQSSGSFTGLAAGVYNVQMRDALHVGCIKVLNGTLTITEPAPAFVVLSNKKDIVKFGDATGEIHLSVSGGTAPYSCLWTNGDTSFDRTGLKAGSYTATVSDSTGASVSYTATLRHIYCELVRKVHHGVLIRLLKLKGSIGFGSRLYKIMWRGIPSRPPFIHPHVDVQCNNVTLGPIGTETVGAVVWNVRSLTVPLFVEGDILVLPSPILLPVFPSGSTITAPVKIYYVPRTFLPFRRPPILIAEFKLLIKNTSVDYTL